MDTETAPDAETIDWREQRFSWFDGSLFTLIVGSLTSEDLVLSYPSSNGGES
jgi:hypothetical protein